MLLTVIAVATLLVAVVGATFAYFSVSNGGTSTTNVRGKIESVGTISLSTGGEHPHLNINAEDMSVEASSSGDKTYYSTITSSKDHADEEGDSALKPIATATLNGGTSGVKYKCTATFTVSVKESEMTSTIQFKEGDAKLKLSGDAGVTSSDLFAEIDLSTLVSSGYTKSGTVTFEFTGDGNTITKNINGYLAITNKQKDGDDSENADQTERLAGKDFTVEIKGDNFTCDTVA